MYPSKTLWRLLPFFQGRRPGGGGDRGGEVWNLEKNKSSYFFLFIVRSKTTAAIPAVSDCAAGAGGGGTKGRRRHIINKTTVIDHVWKYLCVFKCWLAAAAWLEKFCFQKSLHRWMKNTVFVAAPLPVRTQPKHSICEVFALCQLNRWVWVWKLQSSRGFRGSVVFFLKTFPNIFPIWMPQCNYSSDFKLKLGREFNTIALYGQQNLSTEK